MSSLGLLLLSFSGSIQGLKSLTKRTCWESKHHKAPQANRGFGSDFGSRFTFKKSEEKILVDDVNVIRHETANMLENLPSIGRRY